jgi:twinkle protein
MDIRALSQELGRHAHQICLEIFPDGVVESGCYKVGSVDGDRGRSLSVYLHGDKCGKWIDFATGDSGDMLDLIQQSRNVSLTEAMDWGAKRYSIREFAAKPKISPAAKKKYILPTPPPQSNNAYIHEYMESRGFRDVGEVYFRHKIYETQSRGGLDVVFQYFDPDGKLVFIKNKPINYDGHPMPQKDTRPILYGWHTMPKDSRKLWIVEGEWDQIAASELGFPALSVPFGGGKGRKQLNWIEQEFENLKRFEEIIIATDMDEEGELAAEEIKKRFGDRCYRITLPTKDINELLQKQGYDGARTVLEAAYEDARWQDPDTLHSVMEFKERVDAIFENSNSDTMGFRSGWEKLDEEDIRFRPSELWGLTGINGHGKSMWLGQLCLNAIEQGNKVLICSPEMTPERLLHRMLRQAGGSEHPPEAYRDKLLGWLEGNLWLYEDRITPSAKKLLACFEYAYARYGINVFVVDSLTNMVDQQDYSAQQKFVETLVHFKQTTASTIFLVTHSRKGDDENTAPNKFDVKGSGSVTDLADGFMSLWKNKRKADHLEQAAILNEEPDEKFVKQWDVYLEILKNRNGGYEGRVGFQFDPRCLQYQERRSQTAKYYINYSKEKTNG